MGFVYRASLERENWNSIQFQRFGKESWCEKIYAAIRPNCLLFVYFSVGLVELICIREQIQFERSPMGASWNSDPLTASLLAAPASLSVPLSNGWFMAQWNSKPLFLSWSGWQCKSGCRTKEDTGSAVFSSRKYSDFNVWLRLFHIGNINRCLTLFLQVN